MLFTITVVLIVLIVRLEKEQQTRSEKLSEYLEKSIDFDDVGNQLFSERSKIAKSGAKNAKDKTDSTEDDKKSELSSTGKSKLERRRNEHSIIGDGMCDSKTTTSDSKELP